MKNRGKAVETYPDFNPCEEHPDSCHVGICPYCLKDRLAKLVCHDCGKRRVSSCSCSNDVVFFPRSSDVGSVGRMSFLIDNDRAKSTRKNEESVILFGRSSSSCGEVKKRGSGFWRIKGLFGKKRNNKDEFWDENDVVGVARSLSLRSFRGSGSNIDVVEAGKSSDVSNGVFFDSARRFSIDTRRGGIRGCNNVPNRGVFPIKESDFSSMDDSGFIDLKLDSLSELNRGIGGANSSEMGGNVVGWNGRGGSCRVTMNERGLRHRIKNWKWIFESDPKH